MRIIKIEVKKISKVRFFSKLIFLKNILSMVHALARAHLNILSKKTFCDIPTR